MPKILKKGKINLSDNGEKMSVNQFFLISFDNLSKIAYVSFVRETFLYLFMSVMRVPFILITHI